VLDAAHGDAMDDGEAMQHVVELRGEPRAPRRGFCIGA
jgi:hypothetical protein